MFRLSNRCAVLRDDAVNHKQYTRFYCAQRNVYHAIGVSEAVAEGLSIPEVYAAGIIRTLHSFSPFIVPGEWITGFNFGDGRYWEFTAPQDTEEDRLLMLDNGISEEDIAKYAVIRDNAPEHNIGSLKSDRIVPHIPSRPLTQDEIQMASEWAGIGRCIGDNHTVLGYEKVLRLGFEGLKKEVEAWEAKNGSNAMYTAMKALCDASCIIGEKYARKAEELLASGDDRYDPKDLRSIAAVCRRVPRYPAESFLEAVQSLWFAHIINTWDDTINANSIGRLDQILYPYYKADIEKGILTKEEAFEILCCLWIKLYRDYDVQQSCLGGTFPNGKSAVNDLSYLMLDVTEQLGFIRCLSVRYSANTEKDFLRRALEVVGRLQKGVPFFFNDDIMIPALMSKGIKKEDAHDYTQIG